MLDRQNNDGNHKTKFTTEAALINDLILEAIDKRVNFYLYYEGDQAPRLFSPYLLRLANTGNTVIIGRQIRNPSSDNGDDQRRCFNLQKIKHIELTGDHFEPDDSFRPDDPIHAKGMIACVKTFENRNLDRTEISKMTNPDCSNVMNLSDLANTEESDFSIDVPTEADEVPLPIIYGATAIQNIMDKIVFDTGLREVEAMTDHMESHLFLLRFDFKSFGNIQRNEKRRRKYVAIGSYLELAMDKVMQLMADDGGDICEVPQEQATETDEAIIDSTPYAISFATEKGRQFNRNKPIEGSDFDAIVLIHPDFLPYFERYLQRYNRSENDVLLDFVDTSPMRWLKIARYHRGRGWLGELIFEKIADMTEADLQPLLESDSYPLQEYPHREHIWTEFYEWQERAPEENAEDSDQSEAD